VELVDGSGPSEDEISNSVPPADYTQPDQRHEPKAYVPPYVTDESNELSISLDPFVMYDERPGGPKDGRGSHEAEVQAGGQEFDTARERVNSSDADGAKQQHGP
jgi:hypothetical protein